MSKRKSAPAPIVIPAGLTPAQRAMVDGASSDAARVVLLRLYSRVQSP